MFNLENKTLDLYYGKKTNKPRFWRFLISKIKSDCQFRKTVTVTQNKSN